MGRIFDGPGIWIVLVVVLLLFGATRLPALARSIGQSTKIFREEMKTGKNGEADAEAPVSDGVAASVAEPAAPAAPTAKKTAPKKPQAGKSGNSAKS